MEMNNMNGTPSGIPQGQSQAPMNSTPVQTPASAQPASSMPPMKTASKKSSLWIFIVIILVLAIAAAAWFWYMGKLPAGYVDMMQEENTGTSIDAANDTTASIESDIQGTNLGDIDSEFQQVDQDLQNL